MPRLAAVLALGLLLHIPGALQAQVDVKRAKIPTIDGVELRGWFYKGPSTAAPTVLVLHNLGEHSQVQGWKNLAAALCPTYNVMLFDFRGHGESKTVEPKLFWSETHNAQYAGTKSQVGKETIDFKTFNKAYYPALINDIASVKGWLDREADRGRCNTSTFILIGGETGATLGSVWLSSEWVRFKVANSMFGPEVSERPEGKDVVAAVWLSIKPSLGGREVDLPRVLELPARVGATPMIFVHGDADAPGKRIARMLENKIKGKETKDIKYKFTGAVEIPGNKLTGVNLLEQKSLKTADSIALWLSKVIAEKGNETAEHDYQRSEYIWVIGTMQWIVKRTTQLNVGFDMYDKFLQR